MIFRIVSIAGMLEILTDCDHRNMLTLKNKNAPEKSLVLGKQGDRTKRRDTRRFLSQCQKGNSMILPQQATAELD